MQLLGAPPPVQMPGMPALVLVLVLVLATTPLPMPLPLMMHLRLELTCGPGRWACGLPEAQDPEAASEESQPNSWSHAWCRPASPCGARGESRPRSNA